MFLIERPKTSNTVVSMYSILLFICLCYGSVIPPTEKMSPKEDLVVRVQKVVPPVIRHIPHRKRKRNKIRSGPPTTDIKTFLRKKHTSSSSTFPTQSKHQDIPNTVLVMVLALVYILMTIND